MLPNHFNPLPGVPNIESPFFDELFDPADTELLRIARSLNRDGYAVLEFPEPDFDRMASETIAALQGRFDLAAWARSEGSGLRVQDAWRENPNVRSFATNQAMLDLLARLYGKTPFPFQTLNFPFGTQQHYHSDALHFSSMPERFMCGVWLALEDIGPEQGPLVYYPGSHKWPIYGNEHVGNNHQATLQTNQSRFDPVWERLVEVTGSTPERFTARKGTALIWAANLLHGGDHHRDRTRTRWSQVTHYLFDDCSYYTPMHTDLPLGSIKFREPLNVLTGGTVKNRYLGEEVSAEYIAATAPSRVTRAPSVLPADFDPATYLRLNPDVAAAGDDATTHYLTHGYLENRPWQG